MNAILIDAGPLVALLHKHDNNHQLCVESLASLTDPLASVWPVFTEAMYLLNFSWDAQEALWEMVLDHLVKIVPLDHTDHVRMRDLMKQYRSLPMDLADAALVTVAEREKIRRIFTLDRRDFSLYRPKGLGKFSLIPSRVRYGFSQE